MTGDKKKIGMVSYFDNSICSCNEYSCGSCDCKG